MCKRILFAVSMIVILLCNLPGCGGGPGSREEKIYQQTIDAFFGALDAGDADGIRRLFSSAVVSGDADLDDRIQQLITLYPRSKTTVMFRGMPAGEYTQEAGKRKAVAYATFPVVSDRTYYWTYMELIYQDDFAPENVGLNCVHFYTADEYCIFYHAENSEVPLDIGLSVYAQQVLDTEVRCIQSYPYAFVPYERDLNLPEMESFIEKNRDLEAFTNLFGMPNAQGDLGTCYYALNGADGVSVYLELGTQGNKIIYANLVDDLEYIRSILEEKS